jgi:hypothetical protein
VKTSIYLPDDLAEQVKAHGISMSEVVQAALRQAVADADSMAQAQASIRPDVEVAVHRMRQILAEEERQREEVRSAGRPAGIKWARDYATPRELKEFVSRPVPMGVTKSHSLIRFFDDQPQWANSVKRGAARIYVDYSHPWWAGFEQGATMVWDAVQPILERDTQP